MLVTNLDEGNKEFILVGDFNCDLLASDRLNKTTRLLEIANSYSNSNSYCPASTRVAAFTPTLLDLFFAKEP